MGYITFVLCSLFCFLFPLVCAVIKVGAKGWSMLDVGGWSMLEQGFQGLG